MNSVAAGFILKACSPDHRELSMRAKHSAQIILGVIASLAIICPFIEIVDTWDNFALTGPDSNLIILVMLLIFGFRHAELAVAVIAVAISQLLAALKEALAQFLPMLPVLPGCSDVKLEMDGPFTCLAHIELPLRI